MLLDGHIVAANRPPNLELLKNVSRAWVKRSNGPGVKADQNRGCAATSDSAVSSLTDEHHRVQLGWMVAGLLLSQTVCFDHWQRRCRRWLSNGRIEVDALMRLANVHPSFTPRHP